MTYTFTPTDPTPHYYEAPGKTVIANGHRIDLTIRVTDRDYRKAPQGK